MNWIIYVGLFAFVIGVPFFGSMFLTKKQEDDFLGKYSTSIMKGAAILCVMLCHFMGTFGDGVTFFTPFGGIGVAMFLILSAYGLNESWIRAGGYRGWWRKRIIAVIIPYAIIEIFFYWLFHEFDITKFVLDILCIKPLYHNGWYLQYLMLWYAIFYVVMRIKILADKKIIVFAIISTVLFFITREIKAEQSLSFLGGIYLSEYKNSDILKKRIKWKTALMLLITGCAFLVIKQIDAVRSAPHLLFDIVQLMIKLPSALGAMIVLYQISKRINMKLLSWIGTISYELYIIHGYILGALPVTNIGAIMFLVGSFMGSTIFWLLLHKTKKLQMRLFRIA